MTLVRGGILAEPMELARHCAGRANEDGVLPEEDEVLPHHKMTQENGA